MKVTRRTPFDEAFGKGCRFELSVRSFNILKREGAATVGDFLNVTSDDLDRYRNCQARQIIEIAAMQAIVREIEAKESTIRDVLAEFLRDEGVVNYGGGYYEASPEDVADKLLAHFEIEARA